MLLFEWNKINLGQIPTAHLVLNVKYFPLILYYLQKFNCDKRKLKNAQIMYYPPLLWTQDAPFEALVIGLYKLKSLQGRYRRVGSNQPSVHRQMRWLSSLISSFQNINDQN